MMKFVQLNDDVGGEVFIAIDSIIAITRYDSTATGSVIHVGTSQIRVMQEPTQVMKYIKKDQQ